MTYKTFLGPLNHVGVAVSDIHKAIEMYRNVFGVTDITEPAGKEPQRWTASYLF